MPKKKSSELANRLGRQFRTLEATQKRIEHLYQRDLLSKQAILRMYEGMFLTAHISIEAFLEDLFFGLLVSGKGLESSRPDVLARVEIKSHRMARNLAHGTGKPYIDWLPFDQTLKLAKLFFQGGRPFTDLGNPHKDAISRSHYIRNAIAHKSRYSLYQFNRHVIQSVPLPPHERTPAGYLRGLFRAAPRQSRFSNLLARLLLCARELSK